MIHFMSIVESKIQYNYFKNKHSVKNQFVSLSIQSTENLQHNS